MMPRTASRSRASDGQIIVIFALGLVAMIAMVGLVLDGGSTFAQRRGQQNAADLAAMAAANDFLVSGDKARATAAARRRSPPRTGSPTIRPPARPSRSTSCRTTSRVEVDVSAPHRNNFTGVVGMTPWQVSTTARVLVGIPDTAVAGPFLFNKDIFSDPGGVPLPQYSDPDNPFTFGDGNGDVAKQSGRHRLDLLRHVRQRRLERVRSMVDGTNPLRSTSRRTSTSGSTKASRTTATTPRCSATSMSSWSGRTSPSRSWTTTACSRAGRCSMSSARSRAPRP